MPNDSASRPSTCTMPRSWSISCFGRGLPSGLVRGTTSVLMASATTSCSTTPVTLISEADDVELVRAAATVIQPPAAAGQQDEDSGDQAGADEHVGAALRAEQRHGVDQLAEHHLDGPRQREPDGERGELGRRPGERLPDPEGLRDADEPRRPIGEIDHQQRQIGEPHRRGSAPAAPSRSAASSRRRPRAWWCPCASNPAATGDRRRPCRVDAAAASALSRSCCGARAHARLRARNHLQLEQNCAARLQRA